MIKSPGSWQICIQSRMLLYTCYLLFCSHHNNLGKPVATSQTIAECEATDNRGSSSDKHNSKTCKATVKSQTSTLLCSARQMPFTSTHQHSSVLHTRCPSHQHVNTLLCSARSTSFTSTLLCSARSMPFTSTHQHSPLFCMFDVLHINIPLFCTLDALHINTSTLLCSARSMHFTSQTNSVKALKVSSFKLNAKIKSNITGQWTLSVCIRLAVDVVVAQVAKSQQLLASLRTGLKRHSRQMLSSGV